MMKDVKTVIKLLPYGYQFKLNMIVSIITFILITLTLIFAAAPNYYFGIMIILIFFVPIMKIEELFYCQIFSSSALSKKIQLIVFDFLTIAATIISCTILITVSLIKEPFSASNVSPTDTASSSFIGAFAGILVTLIYYVFAYRKFILSTILYGISCGILPAILLSVYHAFLYKMNIYLYCCLIAVIGVMINCIARRIMYRMPHDKLAANNSLKKHL